MARKLGQRISLAPATVAVTLGLVAHVIDQFLYPRAGPVPMLVTAPAVATLLYLHLQPTTYRRIAALALWGRASR